MITYSTFTKPGFPNEYITIAKCGSGYAAIQIKDNDIFQDGIGRYSTFKEAIPEAKEWATDFDLPFIEKDEEYEGK